MANITEVSQWENVIRQIENGEAATGGADGLANIQAKQLANRTKWLKEHLAPMANAVFSGTMKHGANDLAGSAISAMKIYGDNSFYVKYASGLKFQWGIVKIENHNEEVTIDFPISFNNDQYGFSLTMYGSVGIGYSEILLLRKLSSSVIIKTSKQDNIYVCWMAFGG